MNEERTTFTLREAHAEIDRLRVQIDELAERYNAAALEATRLRAEIVQFKHALEMQQHTEMGLRAENEKMMNRLRNPELTWAENSRLRADNDRLRDLVECKDCMEYAQQVVAAERQENNRLRAENAELNKALQKMITEGIARAEAKLILAKTSSHQPASDQEPQKSA